MSGTDALLAVVPVGDAVAGDLYGRIQGTSEAFQLKVAPVRCPPLPRAEPAQWSAVTE